MQSAAIEVPVSATRELQAIPQARGYHMRYRKELTRESIRREIELVARAGFNLILFPVYTSGYTLFPCEASEQIRYRGKKSKFAPIDPLYRDWDPLAEAMEEAHNHGLGFWALVRPYNFHPRYGASQQRLLYHYPHWRIRAHPKFKNRPQARRESYMACPNNREYRRYLGNVLSELVTGYPLDGIVFNATGYSFRSSSLENYPYCFCESCAEAFAEEMGDDLIDVATRGGGMKAISQWQTDVSTDVINHFRQRIMKVRRTLRLVCRTQPQWRWETGESGPALHPPYCIDWTKLLGSGAVEGLIIHHDGENAPEHFGTRLVSDLVNLHHETLLLPTLLVSQVSDFEKPLSVINKYPVSGLLAEFRIPLSEAIADEIREKYFFEPAQLPESAPLLSVAYLLQQIWDRHGDNELLSAYMRDIIRLIERNLRTHASFPILWIIFENLTGLQDAIRRGALGDYPIPETTLRDIGLARRMIRLSCLDVRT